MEEIPGKSTFDILRTRVIANLTNGLDDFREEYPQTFSHRTPSGSKLGVYIDHTLLRQQAGLMDIEGLCREAREWQVHSVCVPSNRVCLARKLLSDSPVLVCTVVGFPFGYANTAGKVEETRTAIIEGAGEIDMVIPIGLVKDGAWPLVFKDIKAVVRAAGPVIVKTILETSELSLEEKIMAAYTACYACLLYTSRCV